MVNTCLIFWTAFLYKKPLLFFFGNLQKILTVYQNYSPVKILPWQNQSSGTLYF